MVWGLGFRENALNRKRRNRKELGWPLKPIEKYEHIGSLIKTTRENIRYFRGAYPENGLKQRRESQKESAKRT